ncbi:MAG: phasin family protein [Rhodocyclaceae bacterium]|jgi:phasin family protein|nr:phasin family protein [Rhodocyclaceae bacterium]
MVTKQEQLNEIQKKNLEAAMRLAQLSIENSQKIMELQVQTAKALFEEGVHNAKAMTAIKEPKDVLDLRTAYAQSTTEKMLSCAKAIAEIASQTQAEVGKMVTEQLSSGSQDVFDSMQKMFKGMPITDQNALGAIQTAMDTTRAAFEQMTKASTDAFQVFSQMGGATKGKK